MKCNNIMPGSLVRYCKLNIFYLVTHLFENRMHVIRINVNDKQTGYRDFSVLDRLDVILLK